MNKLSWRSALAVLAAPLFACAADATSIALQTPSLETVPLVITEVAQGTTYGATADKVEVYCTAAAACPAYRVCDTGSACSAVQAPLGSHQRAVVSRGSTITTVDEVWLADANGSELPSTRLGPVDCPGQQSRGRGDCSASPLAACAIPTLGVGTTCVPPDGSEAFAYDLRFTKNQHGAPESTCDRPVCQQLLGAINAAQSSIAFAIYGIRAQPLIVEALAAAQSRGVQVRGVVDTEDASCTSFGYPDTPTLMAAFAPGAVVCDVGSGYGYIMHNKFFVFDDAAVWTGSTNISDTELGGEYNSDVAALLTSSKLAAIYGTEFEEMHSGLFHNRKADNTQHDLGASAFSDSTLVRSYFSPTDHAIDNAVLPLVNEATQTLDVAMFFFTSQPIADAIMAAKQRGVSVRMVLDAGGAANSYSKHKQLCAAGIEVKTENWGGKSHSKWAVADAGLTTAAVVFGSMNWTASGDTQNDENSLYVRNTAFAAEFHAEFERQWADLTRVPTCTSVSAEGADSSVCSPSNDCHASCSSGSCCDGLDNDYDGKVDLQEEACACSDGIDNDGDGYIDGADYDCKSLPDP